MLRRRWRQRIRLPSPSLRPLHPRPPRIVRLGSDLEGVLAEETAITEAKWFVQSRRVHIVSGVMDERQMPYCRDSPFAQDPKSQGEGFGLVVRSQFCQRCLARMPQGLYASLANQCGWLH